MVFASRSTGETSLDAGMWYTEIFFTSSLGFFGGKNHRARNIVIMDPLETGLRATCDFPGVPFSSEGEILIENIPAALEKVDTERWKND